MSINYIELYSFDIKNLNKLPFRIDIKSNESWRLLKQINDWKKSYSLRPILQRNNEEITIIYKAQATEEQLNNLIIFLKENIIV